MEMFGIAKPKEKKKEVEITEIPNCVIEVAPNFLLSETTTSVCSTKKKITDYLLYGVCIWFAVIICGTIVCSSGSGGSNHSQLNDSIACKKILWQQTDKNNILDLYIEARKIQNK